LNEKGTVTWRCLRGKEVTSETIETFLRLENQGWKREHGKSLLSRPGHAEFFRDMVERFSTAGRTFFTELSLDGRVIASTSNFISGNVGFAFKIGWDDEFAAVSPGLLNELELMNLADRDLASLDFIDSGAAEGSFIDRFWRDSRDVVTGILAGGYVGAAVLPAISIARRLKRGWC
jgi:CelD/BcsL family acetyltransferase involved in cellulose biosynthesis